MKREYHFLRKSTQRKTVPRMLNDLFVKEKRQTNPTSQRKKEKKKTKVKKKQIRKRTECQRNN